MIFGRLDINRALHAVRVLQYKADRRVLAATPA